MTTQQSETLTCAAKAPDLPEGVDDAGRRAHAIIVAYLCEHGRMPDGGDRAFYAPAAWTALGHAYGTRSRLVICYADASVAGKLAPVFSMDAAYELDCAHYRQTGKSREPYALYEGMQAKLREAGLYFEECTRWYAAVYLIHSADSDAEDDAR